MGGEFTVKRDLYSVLEIIPYDPTKPLVIYLDASFVGGFGFIMGQVCDDDTFNIIQCGVTGLTTSQKKYSCYELELTGLAFATK